MAYTPRGSTSGGAATAHGPHAVGRTVVDRGAPLAPGGAPVPRRPRGREMPYWALGLAFVVAGALAANLLQAWTRSTVPVLALARDVPVGQRLAATDLRVEQVQAGTAVPVVAADRAATVVGRTVTVPLRAGRLLAADDVGPPSWPPDGQLLVAVPVTPGAAPPELAAGMHVLVGTGTTDGSAVPAATAWTRNGLAAAPEGVVAGVRDNPSGTGGRVVSLLLTREGAGQVTAIPASQLRLVVLAAPPPPAADPAAPAGDAGQPGGGQPADGRQQTGPPGQARPGGGG